MNTKLYKALWLHNGKSMTLLSYIYAVCAVLALISGDLPTAGLLTVLAELSRVDKATRIATVDIANEIIEEGDKHDDSQ